MTELHGQVKRRVAVRGVPRPVSVILDGDDWLCENCAKPFAKCQDCRHIYPEEELEGGLCSACR